MAKDEPADDTWQSIPVRHARPRILIADDDLDTRNILSDWLTHQGYATLTAADGEKALAAGMAHPLDLALIDVRMPGPAGMELAARLRERHPDLGVIIITAYGSIQDAVEAMRGGAFHYLPKPLAIKQVLAAVEGALARGGGRGQVGEKAGDLTVDLTRRQVSCGGRSVWLTRLEFDLLAYLIQHRGRVVSCDELLEQVWGYPPHNGDPVQVRNAVRRLRKKLKDDASCPRYVVGVRGVGYRWDGKVRLKRSGEGA